MTLLSVCLGLYVWILEQIYWKCEIIQLPRDFYSLWQTELEERYRLRLFLAPISLFLLLHPGRRVHAKAERGLQSQLWLSHPSSSSSSPLLWRIWPLLNSLGGIWTVPLSWDAVSCARHQRELSRRSYFRENLNVCVCVSTKKTVFPQPVKFKKNTLKLPDDSRRTLSSTISWTTPTANADNSSLFQMSWTAKSPSRPHHTLLTNSWSNLIRRIIFHLMAAVKLLTNGGAFSSCFF